MVATTHMDACMRRAPSLMIWAFSALAAVTTLRLAVVILAPVELHGDEAQYWAWSRTLDWGYYSKPPLIAWIIAATTAVFGDAEWAIRIASPWAHAVGATFTGLLARDLYGERAGAWAVGLYTLTPAITLSSGVISTDAPLFAAWAAALFALNRLLVTRAWMWAALLAAAFALGMLAKYAMAYFAIGAALLAASDRSARATLLSAPGLGAIALSLALIAPNLWWNISHDFATVAHLADNANWSGPRFRLGKLSQFWGDQLAVFGPVTFALAAAAVIAAVRGWAARDRAARFLVCFVAPALVIISVQAFINRANANWAATAYIAASALLAGWLFADGGVWDRAHGARRTLWASVIALAVGLNLAVAGILTTAALSPTAADTALCAPGAPQGGRACVGYSFKRVRGLEETARAVAARFTRGHDGTPFRAVVVDNRLLFHNLDYYWREAPPPLRIWLKDGNAQSYAQEVAPLTPATTADGPVLVVSERARDHVALAADFTRFAHLETVEIDRGAAGPRRLWFFIGEGFAAQPR